MSGAAGVLPMSAAPREQRWAAWRRLHCVPLTQRPLWGTAPAALLSAVEGRRMLVVTVSPDWVRHPQRLLAFSNQRHLHCTAGGCVDMRAQWSLAAQREPGQFANLRASVISLRLPARNGQRRALALLSAWLNDTISRHLRPFYRRVRQTFLCLAAEVFMGM